MFNIAVCAGPAGGYVLKIGCHERLLHRKESVLAEIEAHLSDYQTATREFDEYKRACRLNEKELRVDAPEPERTVREAPSGGLDRVSTSAILEEYMTQTVGQAV